MGKGEVQLKLDRFDLNLLVTLDALLDTCSVTQAARRLGIGQSACSAALARLRAHFGNELLAPAGRRLLPTPFATGLREPVRQALIRARDVVSARATFDPTLSHHSFVLSASDYVMAELVAPLQAKLAIEAPGIVLQLRTAPGERIAVSNRDEVDFQILPHTLALPTNNRRILFHDDVVVLADAQNQKVQGAHLTNEDLAGLLHVIVQLTGDGTPSFPGWKFPSQAVRWTPATTVDRFGLAPFFVIGTERIALLPRLLAERYVGRYPLRLLEMPPGLDTRFELDLIWSHHLHDSPPHVWLRERILQAGREVRG